MNKPYTVVALLSLLGLGIANADIVVIGNVAAANLTKGEVSDIFLGKTAGVIPLDQPASAPIKGEFYLKVTSRELNQVKAIWARLTFSGQGQPPKELSDDAAIVKAVAADPKAVGYIHKNSADATVKILLSID